MLGYWFNLGTSSIKLGLPRTQEVESCGTVCASGSMMAQYKTASNSKAESKWLVMIKLKLYNFCFSIFSLTLCLFFPLISAVELLETLSASTDHNIFYSVYSLCLNKSLFAYHIICCLFYWVKDKVTYKSTVCVVHAVQYNQRNQSGSNEQFWSCFCLW